MSAKLLLNNRLCSCLKNEKKQQEVNKYFAKWNYTMIKILTYFFTN